MCMVCVAFCETIFSEPQPVEAFATFLYLQNTRRTETNPQMFANRLTWLHSRLLTHCSRDTPVVQQLAQATLTSIKSC